MSLAFADGDAIRGEYALSSGTVAVLLPCYNEAAAIEDTVLGFKKHLPDAKVYVFDNASTDDTASRAQRAGAIVFNEPRKGKGNVVRRMFADIDADIYVLADGDATYDPSSGPIMIELLRKERLDMVVGCRQETNHAAYRAGHRLGNIVLSSFLAWLFGRAFTDTLSGYRVFSRRFVKTFPSLSSGFEIETEINVHALELRMPVSEINTLYRERGHGSESKLNTLGDGVRILGTIFSLFRREKPFFFFSIISTLLILVAADLFLPLAVTFMHTRLVPRLPTAILCTGLMLIAMLSFVCGLILDTVTHGRREIRRLAYLNLKASL